MYWYYKYPLLGILVLLLFGVGYIVWQSRSSDRTAAVAQVQDEATGGSLPSAAPPEQIPVRSVPPSVPATPTAKDVSPAPATPAPATSPPVEVIPRPVGPPAHVLRLLSTARAQLAAGNLETGRELARRAMHAEGVVEFDKLWYEAAEMITKANSTFMNSGAPCSEKVGYTIQPGDNLTVIANRLNTTVGALQRMNPEMLGATTARIYPGKTLFALRCDWSIRVVKGQYVLLLNNGPELFKLYHIAVGRENRTPPGTFDIVNKIMHPDWTHPSGKVIPYGDKANVLGTHWMALKPTGTTNPALRGFGIHGTWEPDSIGTMASLGCVRMRNDEVAELYDFIPLPGANSTTKVTIE